jgi:hypothetical protein
LHFKRGETTRLSPWFGLTTTPTYNRQTFGISLTQRF